MTENYTLPQLMVAAAAREIADHEVVFVGMRLPLLGFLLAGSTHAPHAVGVYELGVVRDTLSPEPIMTMGDLPNLTGACWLADTIDIMSLLQKGLVDISFIGGAQVDRFGNLNTSYIGGFQSPATRLPGSGGACDLACLAKRHIIVMTHEKRRFKEKVDYITSPGYGDGAGWRERVGLPRGGPRAVITTLGVLRFDPMTCEMVLVSVRPGVSVETVSFHTGWPLKIAPDLSQTPAPTQAELAMIRRFDPEGYWTGSDKNL
ncbi:MAG: CoA-transferase [Desulfobacterales bacterium CG07_land_8_20_14_0_80_52_14]|nr:MAG: CoA-transferase [Desulfobacterales bacterium CG23_combo_of_CG06-09_8_20_14_all_52_9]PIU50072.1 MAG: CoA-transferase [Desulfobacterales bacterium CG07_land_8_20_14_0_80_52_14]